ncbi:MAG TPA: hypothetical protein DCS93_21505 [Microscillaceae bacterium]|nr:hypothetical protein [Microscillaceae bacterium]
MQPIIQKAIANLLLQKAQALLNQPHNHYLGLQLKAKFPEDCRNEDIETLASMTDLNTSTLRRFMSYTGRLNYQNQQKILLFLEYKNWDVLLIDAVQLITGDTHRGVA